MRQSSKHGVTPWQHAGTHADTGYLHPVHGSQTHQLTFTGGGGGGVQQSQGAAQQLVFCQQWASATGALKVVATATANNAANMRIGFIETISLE